MSEPTEPDTLDDPELQSLAADLRSEWHAEYDETAGEARMQWEHGRTIIDRVHDAMARGDRLQITVGRTQFSGTATNLGTDWCTIDAAGGSVDIRLLMHMAQMGTPAIIRCVERGRSGGIRAPQPPMGFRARCYELEMEGRPVRVGSLGSDEVVSGALTVGADHLVISDSNGDTFLPIDWVSWIAAAE